MKSKTVFKTAPIFAWCHCTPGCWCSHINHHTNINSAKTLFGIQQIALLYLLPIMVSTVYGGLTPGIMAGVLAFFTFNYYFIEPCFTLRVHTTQDLITIAFFNGRNCHEPINGQAREGIRLA